MALLFAVMTLINFIYSSEEQRLEVDKELKKYIVPKISEFQMVPLECDDDVIKQDVLEAAI